MRRPARSRPASRPARGPPLQGRNRRCITIDLHNEEGRRVLRQLANRCDVLVENFRPGVMEKWQAGGRQRGGVGQGG